MGTPPGVGRQGRRTAHRLWGLQGLAKLCARKLICYPGPGEQCLSAKRLAIRRFTASVPVA
eukprot:2610735-Prymnesium_polylepis.1